jgi:hypothetical protein
LIEAGGGFVNLQKLCYTTGHTHHDYVIRLSLEDVSALLSVLGHVASKTDAQLLREQLGKDVPGLVKMLACANGIAPMPMPEPAVIAAATPAVSA